MFLPNPGILAAGAGSFGGQQLLTQDNRLFTVPSGVFSVCAVLISTGGQAFGDESGGNSGGGGGLAYSNDISVTPGELLVADFPITGTCVLRRSNFTNILAATAAVGNTPGSGTIGQVLRTGGSGRPSSSQPTDGGGAAGYTSNGQSAPTIGTGKGGGGTSALGGGAGASSGSESGPAGGVFGGGAGQPGGTITSGGPPCVRIIWGEGRAFPNTNTGDL